ncbi:MAG: acetylornithine transaminase [Candidatus Schekmanbacteria bacterium]|nr:acetylornithine transaminase [Candidatus Schekmanbacteria bacterium]
METSQLLELSQQYLMSTYARQPVIFTRGAGAILWDNEGRKYLDFACGLAVCALGHCHPHLVEAIQKQSRELLHVSNLYHIKPQIELAQRLVENSFADKVFFCNSGAEANEAAIKLARRYAWGKWGGQRYKIITCEKSFHGRTIATITATGQSKFQTGFSPLLEGFSYVPYNDISALEAAIDHQTIAVMLEPIQAEGGVNMPDPGYLEDVRRLCDQHHLLMILDEVQTGIGRTGRLFGYQHHGIEPDMISLAKGLGGGVAIGALLAVDKVAQAFVPGTHASTFGGNPLACSAALAVLDVVLQNDFLPNVQAVGQYLEHSLTQLKNKYAFIQEIRGIGCIWGMELDRPAAPIISACLKAGLVIVTAGEKVLRFLPPLIIGQEHVDQTIAILDGVLGESYAQEVHQ